MIDSWRDAPDIWEDAYAAMLAAAPPPPADAEVWVFKGTDGAWRTFHNEQHRLDTIADGRWEVRKFTALSQQPEAQGGGEVAAWETEDGRVISARQKATALRDGGASASSVAPYTTPLYRTAPPSAPVEVDAPGSRSWMAEVCRAAALSLAAHGVRNDQLSKVADWIAQQPAPSAPVGVEDVDALAQEIRRVDGEHSLGASALAEALVPYLARTTLAQQPAAVYQCPRCATSMEVDPTAKPAAVGEEIMVNAAHDVFTLPLQPSGLSSGPRFVVHVPAPEQQPAAVDEAMVERAAAAVMSAPPGISVEAYVRIALEAALATQHQEPKS